MTEKATKRGEGEKALAGRVVAWLESQHYDVYQEVQVGALGNRADIVVAVNGWGWVIETKTSLGFSLMGQAFRWLRAGVTRISIAIPRAKRNDAGREFAIDLCHREGIGIIDVDKYGIVRERIEPRFRRQKTTRRDRDILAFCHNGHKECARAGSHTGGHWTPYSNTMREVRRFLQDREWVSLKELLGGINHHYRTTSTARSCLAKWLQTIETDKGWVEARLNSGHLEFRLVPEPPPTAET